MTWKKKGAVEDWQEREEDIGGGLELCMKWNKQRWPKLIVELTEVLA